MVPVVAVTVSFAGRCLQLELPAPDPLERDPAVDVCELLAHAGLRISEPVAFERSLIRVSPRLKW